MADYSSDQLLIIILVGGLIFLTIYLALTTWCGNKNDHFIQQSIRELGVEYDETSSPMVLGSISLPCTTVPAEVAEEDALGYYKSFHGDPQRIDRSLQFQEFAGNKYSKAGRYC
jgi:hypothetical protein